MPPDRGSLPRFVVEVVDVNGAWASVEQELSSFCSPLPGVRLVNTLGTPVDLAPLPIGFVPSTDPRLARLRKHASSPAAWFRNPVATVVVVGGDDSDDWKRGGSGVSGSGGNSNNNDLPAAARPSSLPSPSSSSGRAAARAVAERAADPLAGPGDWCILYVPPNRGEQRASRGSNGEGGSAATTTEGEGAPSSSSSSNTPTAAAAASAVDSVASSKAALRMFSTLRAEFSTRRHERCVRVSDDDGRGNSSSSSVAAVGPVPSSAALSSVSFSLPPAWATQLARLLAAAASQALAARSEAYSKAGRALAAASSAERAAAAAEEGKGARAKAARGTSSSPSRPSFAPLFLAKDSRAAMLSASGMTDDAIAEYAELEALHSSYFDGVEEAERGDGESSPSASASTSASSTFADDATAAFAAPWSETRRAALRASSSKNTKGSSDSSFFLESLGVRQGVFARRAALLSGSGRHAELADAGARFVASVSAALGDERRRRTRRRRGKVESSPAPDPSLLALLPEAWTASACIALAEAAVRRPREMRELVEARREALAPSEGRGERRRGRGGSWGLALGGEDGASPPPPPPPLSPTDPLGRALAARAGDLYLAARDELGKLLLLVAAPNAAGDASPPLPLPSFSSSLRSVPSQPHPLSSAAAAASLAGGGSVAGLSPSPTRGRGAAAGGGGSDISRSAVVIARTGTGTGISSGGSDGHLVATAGAAAGGGGVLMSVASLSRASPLPQTSDAAAAAGAGAGSEGRASAASGENGKATSSVAGSDGGASSSSQQQQPATATAAPAAAAASGGGGTIRPFLARAAELRFRSSTSTAAAAAAAAADISVSGASTAAVAASSVADWASDPSAIEAEIESEGEEGRGKGENGDGDSGGDEETAATAATAPRASSSSSSPSSPSRLPPPWVTDPRLRLALSAPSDEGAALWLALSKAAAAAYRISGRTRRAAAAAASSAAAAAATGDPVGAQKALREEVALACGERWDRLSAAVLPALLEMRGGGSDNDEGERGETDRDEERGTAVSPETALAALSLRDGLLPLRARQRAQAALAEAAEGRGRRGGAEAATEPPSVPLDGGTALTVLPVPGAFSRMVLSRNYSAAGSAAAPLLAPAPGAAAAGAGAGAVLCAVGDDDAILQVDVASRLPHPLERVRPVLRLSLQQEVVVDSASSSPRAAFPVVPSPAASAKDVGGGGGGPAARFSAEWRETDVVECHRLVSSSPSPSPSSPSLVELAPGAKTRLRFALCPLASGAYALKDVLLDLLPSSKNDKNDGEKTFPPSSSLLSILAPRQPLPELRAAAAVPRSEVLLFAVPPRPRARLRVPPAGAGEEAAATAAAATTTRLIAGVPQWLAAAAFEQERGGVGEGIETSSRNLLSSASLFVSPRAPRCNASGGSGGGAKGGRSRRASLAGAAGGAAAGGRSPPFSLSRSVSSVSTSSASTATTRKRSLVRASWSLRPGTAAVAVRLPGSSSPGESSAVECVVVAEAGAERGLGSWLRVSPRSSSSSSLPLPGAKKGERTLVWLWVEPAAAAEGEEGGEGGGGEEEEEGRVAAAAAAPLLSAKVPAASMATKQQQQRHRQQQQQQRHRQQQQHHHHHSRLPSFLSLPLTLPRCGAFEADVQLEYRGGGGLGGGGIRALAARLSVPAAPPFSLSARLLLLPRASKTAPVATVFELRVRSGLPWPIVLRSAALSPQAGTALGGGSSGGNSSSLSAPLPLTLEPGATASLACVLHDAGDDEEIAIDAATAAAATAAAPPAPLKPSRVSLCWEAVDSADAAAAVPAASSFCVPPPPLPAGSFSSSPLSGTAAADFFVDAPLADALPLMEEEEGGGRNKGDADGDGGGDSKGREEAASASLIAVRFLGPFSASPSVPTTLCWRLERLPPPPSIGAAGVGAGESSSSSSSSFRFEVIAPRGGGWELSGSSTGNYEQSAESDDDEGGEGGAAAAAAVGGTVRLSASPGSAAVVEASWTPSPSSPSVSSSSPSPSPLRAPTLAVFAADGREVGRSVGGGGAAAGGAGAASEEFVFVGGGGR